MCASHFTHFYTYFPVGCYSPSILQYYYNCYIQQQCTTFEKNPHPFYDLNSKSVGFYKSHTWFNFHLDYSATKIADYVPTISKMNLYWSKR